MTCTEFETKLKAIYQTLFDDEFTVNDEVDKNWLNAIISHVSSNLNGEFPFFLLVEDDGEIVEFMINVRDNDLFRAKKEEINNIEEDFIPQIKVKDSWESYEFNFSTLLLTEYVNWLYEVVQNKFEMQIWGYGLYIPVKEHWNQFLNPFSYPSKIWIGKKMKSILLIQNESNLLKCLASNNNTLDVSQKILEN